MKTVIADNMADLVDPIYDADSNNNNGALVLLQLMLLQYKYIVIFQDTR